MINRQYITGMALGVMSSGVAMAGEAYSSGGDFLENLPGRGLSGARGLFGGGGSGVGSGAPILGEGWDVTAAAGISLAQGNADSVAYSLPVSYTHLTLPTIYSV